MQSTCIYLHNAPMQALKDLSKDLIGLYSYAAEASIAFLTLHGELSRVRDESKLDTRQRVKFGKGSPNNPGAKYQYTKTYGRLLKDFARDGPHFQLHRKSAIALAYAMWEDQYRRKIAEECGMADKNEIKSDVFQDLNKYRQAILHRGGTLDREPKIIRFFKKGDPVSFTSDHMHELFSILIDELNQIGKTYYGQNPQFSFDKLLDQPVKQLWLDQPVNRLPIVFQ